MSDSLAFLIADVARLTRLRFDERARLLGVTRAQWKVLLTLSREEGLNQETIADRVEVQPISLCRMIDRLEEATLVERRRDPSDRRAWRIFLTDRARPMIAKLRALADDLSVAALEGLPETDRQHLAASLRAMHANLLELADQKLALNG